MAERCPRACSKIGATTTDEYRLIEKDVALARRFQPILVPEPSVAQSITILRGLRRQLLADHKMHDGVVGVNEAMLTDIIRRAVGASADKVEQRAAEICLATIHETVKTQVAVAMAPILQKPEALER